MLTRLFSPLFAFAIIIIDAWCFRHYAGWCCHCFRLRWCCWCFHCLHWFSFIAIMPFWYIFLIPDCLPLPSYSFAFSPLCFTLFADAFSFRLMLIAMPLYYFFHVFHWYFSIPLLLSLMPPPFLRHFDTPPPRWFLPLLPPFDISSFISFIDAFRHWYFWFLSHYLFHCLSPLIFSSSCAFFIFIFSDATLRFSLLISFSPPLRFQLRIIAISPLIDTFLSLRWILRWYASYGIIYFHAIMVITTIVTLPPYAASHYIQPLAATPCWWRLLLLIKIKIRRTCADRDISHWRHR